MSARSGPRDSSVAAGDIGAAPAERLSHAEEAHLSHLSGSSSGASSAATDWPDSGPQSSRYSWFWRYSPSSGRRTTFSSGIRSWSTCPRSGYDSYMRADFTGRSSTVSPANAAPSPIFLSFQTTDHTGTRCGSLSGGADYKIFGLIPSNIHFFGVDEPGVIHLLGTESIGRDMLSRILSATRVSLSVGLVGITISFFLGCLLGGVSGYFGGAPDMIIQRIIEFLQNIPQIPLWMGAERRTTAGVADHSSVLRITIILSIFAWTGLARVVRGKLLATREEDYVLAAKIAGSGEPRILVRHLLPSFTSYLIVSITLAIPQMILGEPRSAFWVSECGHRR